MPTACLIIIGNEILSGRTRDKNLPYIGTRCDELGIDLAESRIIPDEQQIIIQTIDECRARFTYVFTTGGIGPTHDDITSQAVACAFGVDLLRNELAVQAMDSYYEPGQLNESRLKMADIPSGATLIENPVSGAPGYQIENVFVLPGVPLILQAMFDGMTDRLTGGDPIITQSILTNLSEGTLAEGLAVLQDEFPQVNIGSYPYFKKGKLGVNLVSRSTDRDTLEKLGMRIKELIISLNGEVISQV